MLKTRVMKGANLALNTGTFNSNHDDYIVVIKQPLLEDSNVNIKTNDNSKQNFEVPDVTEECDVVNDGAISPSNTAVYLDNITFETEQEANLNTRSSVKPFTCNICSYKFDRISVLIRHLRTHTKEKPSESHTPKKSLEYNQNRSAVRHLNVDEAEKKFSCEVCPFKCNDRGNLQIHVRLHTGEKPFACNVCPYKCSNKSRLKQHLTIHTGERPYSCDMCPYRATQKSTLTRHKKIRHKDTKRKAKHSKDIYVLSTASPCSSNEDENVTVIEQPLAEEYDVNTNINVEQVYVSESHNELLDLTEECDVLNDGIISPSDAPVYLDNITLETEQEASLETHRKEKLFSCNICSYKTKRNTVLTEHLRIHTGDKPFICDICSHKFRTKIDLKCHLKRHTEEKPFACPVLLCPYRTRWRAGVKQHLKSHETSQYNQKSNGIHDVNKTLLCEICSLKFKDKTTLKQHLGRHAGEKSFLCDFCPYKCANKNRLKLHLTIHTGERPYSCDMCPYRARQKSTLMRHKKLHKDTSPQTEHMKDEPRGASEDVTDDNITSLEEKKPNIEDIQGEILILNATSYIAREHEYAVVINQPRKEDTDEDINRNDETQKVYNSEPSDEVLDVTEECDVANDGTISPSDTPVYLDDSTYEAAQEANLNTRSSVKPFSCNICSYKFDRISVLIRHLWTHTEEKPFEGHATKQSLEYISDIPNNIKSKSTKLKTPTRAKPKRTFTQRVKVRAIEKYFLCDVCSYKCRKKNRLKQHLTIHTGERPYSCDMCPYRATQKSTLTRHKKIRHKDTKLKTKHSKDEPSRGTEDVTDDNNTTLEEKLEFEHIEDGCILLNVSSYSDKEEESAVVIEQPRGEDSDENINTSDNLQEGYKSDLNCEVLDVEECDVVNDGIISPSDTPVYLDNITLETEQEANLETHTGENSFICNICFMRCRSAGNLKQHLITHTGEKPFSCYICFYKCNQKSSLKRHLKTHTGEKPFICNICSYKCIEKSSLKRHLKTHPPALTKHLRTPPREIRKYSCTMCPFKCNSKIYLKRHRSIHRNDTSFTCDICLYKCTGKRTFISHIRSCQQRNAREPMICEICSYKSRSKFDFKRHLVIHRTDLPICCNLCSYRCKRKSVLTRHLRTHTGEKPFSCDICSYKCSEKTSLKYHLKRHTDEKPFVCEVPLCTFRTRWKTVLDTHLKIHSEENLFTCDICWFKCETKNKLIRHLNVHDDEKTFLCEICSYKCSDQSNLKQHLNLHTGEKPFLCNVCPYRCSKRNRLNQHINTHTGEKPYSCDMCPYRATQKSTLTRHKQKHALIYTNKYDIHR